MSDPWRTLSTRTTDEAVRRDFYRVLAVRPPRGHPGRLSRRTPKDDSRTRLGGAVCRERPDPVRLHHRTTSSRFTGAAGDRPFTRLGDAPPQHRGWIPDPRAGARCRRHDATTGRLAGRIRRSGRAGCSYGTSGGVVRPRGSSSAARLARQARTFTLVPRIQYRREQATCARRSRPAGVARGLEVLAPPPPTGRRWCSWTIAGWPNSPTPSAWSTYPTPNFEHWRCRQLANALTDIGFSNPIPR